MSGGWWTILKVIAASVALLAITSCSDGGEEVNVNSRMFVVMSDGTLAFSGGGCSRIKLPASGGAAAGGGLGDFSFSEGAEGDAFVVRVFSDQELLASRSYGVAMLRYSQVDEFGVTTHAGTKFVLRHWGGSCTNLSASSP